MTDLTIPNESTEVEYTVGATPSTGPFTIPFSFFDNDDIRVSHDDGTVITELVNVTDFVVTGTAVEGGFDGGSLTLNVAVSDVTLKVYRSIIIDRTINFPEFGLFNVGLLNTQLNKVIAIEQELAALKANFINLGQGVLAGTDWDFEQRAACNAKESADDDCLATNRQVDANGPNWLEDTDDETAVGAADAWQNLLIKSLIKIEGNDSTKFFDLYSKFFCILQNRGGNPATFRIRYRYQVDCYSLVSKESAATFQIDIPALSAIPFSFMDIAQDIDYTNGNCTLMVAVDIRPVGADSASLWAQWKNLAVNTSDPR